MGILSGYPEYALYMFTDSFEVGKTSLIDWPDKKKAFDYSTECVVYWPERPKSSAHHQQQRGRKGKAEKYSATILLFDESKLTLRGLASQLEKGLISIEEVEDMRNPVSPVGGPGDRKPIRRRTPTEKVKASYDSADDGDFVLSATKALSAKKAATKRQRDATQKRSGHEIIKQLCDQAAVVTEDEDEEMVDDDEEEAGVRRNNKNKQTPQTQTRLASNLRQSQPAFETTLNRIKARVLQKGAASDEEYIRDPEIAWLHKKQRLEEEMTAIKLENSQLKERVEFFEGFMEVKFLVSDLESMKNTLFKVLNSGCGVGGKPKAIEVNIANTSTSVMESEEDDETTTADEKTSVVPKEDKSSPSTDEFSPRFPISPQLVAKIPKNIKLTFFVGRLLDNLFDLKYQTSHTLTNKGSAVGDKTAMEADHLTQILEVVNKRYPVANNNDDERFEQERIVRKTITTKLNNSSSKAKRESGDGGSGLASTSSCSSIGAGAGVVAGGSVQKK